MTSSFCLSMALVATCAAWGVFAQPPQAQLRGNGGSAPGQMLLRVVNNATFPVTLVNCAANFTVAATHAKTQAYASVAALANTSFFWVVPKGESVDCNSGCPECFYVAFGLEAGGGLVMRLGFETDDNDDDDESWEDFAKNYTSGPAEKAGAADKPDGAVTGLELVVSRASDRVRESAACGPSFCSPDWERDHAVAWNTTIDLVIAGSSEMPGLATPSSVGHIESLGRWRRRGRVFRRRWHRPAVWRRPIWRRPIYRRRVCLVCSRFCLWRCR